MRPVLLFASLMASLIQAQPPTAPLPAPPRPPRPPHPIFEALDANRDGVITANEMANASAALKKVDKNGDGMLSPDEYRPRRPDAPGSQGAPPARREDPQGASNHGHVAGDRPIPGRERPVDGPPQRPRPLLDTVLDANGDEMISADEILAAPTRLKKLDANGDGQLSLEECLPKHPMGPKRKGEPRPDRED